MVFLQRVCVISVCIFSTACSSVHQPQSQTLAFNSTNGDPLYAHLHLPAANSAAPHPVVIDLHGCNGVWRQRNRQWIPRLTAEKFAVLQVDSFRTRGVSNVCSDPFKVAPIIRVMDVVAALRFIAGRSDLDEDRTFLMGMSHGGTTALLTNMHDSGVFSRLKGIIAYYPYCPGILPVLNTDLLVLIGALDDWTPAALCREMEIINDNQNDFKLIVYPGAHHTFDVRGLNQVYQGHRVRYHSRSARNSFKKTRRFLRQRL